MPARERATALMRTSLNTVVREWGDFSAGVFDSRGHLIAQAERAMRVAIAAVPDGCYGHTGYGDRFDAPLKLQVTITKRGDPMHVDWAGTAPESPRGINVVLNYPHANVTYALKCALCPEVPNNTATLGPTSGSPATTPVRARRATTSTPARWACRSSRSRTSRRSSCNGARSRATRVGRGGSGAAADS